MKKIKILIVAFYGISFLIISCRDLPKNNNLENNVNDTITSKDVNNDSISKEISLKSSDIQVKVFFKEIAHTNADFKRSRTIGNKRERVSFQKQKSCDFNSADCYYLGNEACHIREIFDNIIIKGIGKNISVIVLNKNKVVFSRYKIELTGQLVLTNKEIDFNNEDIKSTYKIIIKQGGNLLFEGVINDNKYEECYHG